MRPQGSPTYSEKDGASWLPCDGNRIFIWKPVGSLAAEAMSRIALYYVTKTPPLAGT